MSGNSEPDPKGERGGDKGHADQQGKGPQAEKGDQRREKPASSGPTRGGSQHNQGTHDSRSGSKSNAGT